MAEFWSPIFQNMAEKKAAAISALRQTSYGRGNVITVVEENGEIKFRIPILNKSFTRIQDAIAQAGSMNLNAVVSFGSPGAAGREFFRAHQGGEYNQAAEMFRTMYESAQSLSQDQLDVLRNAGIDISQLQDLTMDVLTLQDKKGEAKRVAQLLKDAGKSDLFSGGVSMTDDGVRVLRFKSGTETLTSYQAALLRAVVGQSQLNRATFEEILDPTRVDSNGNLLAFSQEKLVGKLAKVAKREKGILAPRDIGLVNNLMNDFFSGSGGMKIFGNSPNVLALDPQLDLLLKFAGSDFLDESADIRAAKSAFYGNKDPQNYFRDLFGLDDSKSVRAKYIKNNDVNVISDLQDAIRAFEQDVRQGTLGRGSRGSFESKALEDYLIKNFARKSAFRKGLVDDIFKNIEYSMDGAALINEKHLRSNLLPALKKELSDRIESERFGYTPHFDHKPRIRELQGLIARIENNELSQITGRGYSDELGKVIKTAFTSTNFTGALEKFGLIVTPFDFKDEVSSLRSNALALSGLGDVSERVYIDPMSAAFHHQTFLGEEDIVNMTRLSKAKLAQVEEAVQANQIPETILRHLRKTMEQDIELVPYEMQASARRNREFARALLEFHGRGGNLRNSPQMINMLYAMYQSEAFRYRDGVIQGVSPLSRNFAIASEANFIGDSILGRGTERIDIAGMNAAQDILQFRVSGHRLGFAPQMTAQVRAALGGYDNDDKIVTTMRMYNDKNGNSKLGFYITRRPSGYQESIFARAVFDNDTIKYLFGEDEFFMKTLSEMAYAGGTTQDDHTLYKLMEILDPRSRYSASSAYTYNSDVLEQGIVRVYNQMKNNNLYSPVEMTAAEIERISKYGSTPLRVNPADFGAGAVSDMRPAFASDIVSKIYSTSVDSDSLKSKLLEVLSDSSVDPVLKSRIESAGSYDDMMKALGQAMRGSNIEESFHAQAILERLAAVGQIASAAEGRDILGVYINRSMVAGSMLPQYEAALETIKAADPNLADYIKNNFDFAMMEYEEAIDLSTTFSADRQLADIDTIVSKSGLKGAEADALRRRLRRFSNRLGALPPVKGEGFLGAAGRDLISQMGLALGFMQTVSSVTDENEVLGIDKTWIESRLSKGDAMAVVKNIKEGINQGRSRQRTIAQRAIDLEAKIDQVLKAEDEEKAKQFLLDNFGLSADNPFARAAKAARELGLEEAAYGASKRLNLIQVGQDVALRNAATNDESMAVARKILADNEKYFKYLDDLFTDDYANFTETQKAMHDIRLNELGTNVARQIDDGVQVANVSMETLVNSLDQLTEGQYNRDIGALRYLAGDGVSDVYKKVYDKFEFVRNMRRHSYYAKFDQTAALQAVTYLESFGSQLTSENVQQRASEALEQISDRQAQTRIAVKKGTLEQAVYEILANTRSASVDEVFEEEARRQANILRSILFFQDLTPEQQAMRVEVEALGAMSSATAPPDNAGLRRLIEAAEMGDVPSRRAEYSRLTRERVTRLFDNKLFRRGAIGAAALAFASFGYSKIRDINHEKLSGPPLLPGGNPYDPDSNNQSLPQASFDPRNVGVSSGMSYRVNINGSNEDIQRFNTRAGGLVNGSSNTTIYNSLPRMNRDPYAEMGRSY